MKRKNNKGDRELIIKLMRKHDGKCAICGRQCEDTVGVDGNLKRNHATVGHVYTRYQLQRFCIGGKNTRLECHRCNHLHAKRIEDEMNRFYYSISPNGMPKVSLIELICAKK